MKKLREKLAAKAGFTLVELIVVIAILAILAAVAVPAYTGYINRANEAADYAQLDAIKTAVIVKVTEVNVASPVEVTSITVTEGSVTYNSNVDVDISDYYAIGDFEFKSDNTQAVWSAENQTWTLS